MTLMEFKEWPKLQKWWHTDTTRKNATEQN